MFLTVNLLLNGVHVKFFSMECFCVIEFILYLSKQLLSPTMQNTSLEEHKNNKSNANITKYWCCLLTENWVWLQLRYLVWVHYCSSKSISQLFINLCGIVWSVQFQKKLSTLMTQCYLCPWLVFLWVFDEAKLDWAFLTLSRWSSCKHSFSLKHI